jgi:hypothetical protein
MSLVCCFLSLHPGHVCSSLLAEDYSRLLKKPDSWTPFADIGSIYCSPDDKIQARLKRKLGYLLGKNIDENLAFLEPAISAYVHVNDFSGCIFIKIPKFGNSSFVAYVCVGDLDAPQHVCVVKAVKWKEVLDNRRVPEQMGNVRLCFPEGSEISFGRMIVPRCIFDGERLLSLYEILEYEGQRLAFMPVAAGTSNPCATLTPQQLQVMFRKLAQAVCCMHQIGINLTDFHRDNYRYDPTLEEVSIFDLASHHGRSPEEEINLCFSEILFSCLVEQLFPQFREIGPDMLRRVNVSLFVSFLQEVTTICQQGSLLHTCALKFAEDGVVCHQVFRSILSGFGSEQPEFKPEVTSWVKLFNAIESRENTPYFDAIAKIARIRDARSLGQCGNEVLPELWSLKKEVASQICSFFADVIKTSRTVPNNDGIFHPDVWTQCVAKLTGSNLYTSMDQLFVMFRFAYFVQIVQNGSFDISLYDTVDMFTRLIRERIYFEEFHTPLPWSGRECSSIEERAKLGYAAQ